MKFKNYSVQEDVTTEIEVIEGTTMFSISKEVRKVKDQPDEIDRILRISTDSPTQCVTIFNLLKPLIESSLI